MDKNNDGVWTKEEGRFQKNNDGRAKLIATCDTNGDEELVFEEARKCGVGFGVQCNYYLLVREMSSRSLILMEMESGHLRSGFRSLRSSCKN